MSSQNPPGPKGQHPQPDQWGPPPGPQQDPWANPAPPQPQPQQAPHQHPQHPQPQPQPGFQGYPGPGPGPQDPRPGAPTGPGVRPGPPGAGHAAPAGHRGHPGPVATKTKRSPLPIIIGAVAVTLVLVGVLVASLVSASTDSMEKGVNRYFEALGKTYSDELANHVVNVPDAAALEDARKLARSQTYTVNSVRTSGTIATVDYTVSGRTETVDLEMRKVDGTWKVVDGFSEITIRAKQAGTGFSLGYAIDTIGTDPVIVYPGTYELQASSDSAVPSYLWDPSGAEKYVTLKPGEKKTLEVDAVLNKNGEDRVRSALASAFSRCMSGSDVAPQGCPFSVPEPTDRASTYGNWNVTNSASRYEVAQKATIKPSQPFNAVCGDFTANVVYEYRNSAGYQKVPAAKTNYTGCADLTEDTPTVAWK